MMTTKGAKLRENKGLAKEEPNTRTLNKAMHGKLWNFVVFAPFVVPISAVMEATPDPCSTRARTLP